jgi:predicted phage tail protein
MTNTLDSSIETIVALLRKMTEDYARAHGQAVYSGTDIDDGWDELAAQISGATQQLNDVWSATRSHSEHRHIRAVEETLGELHDSLVGVSSATTNYLTVEASTKQKMDGEGQVDMVDLEMARSQLEKADKSLTLARSNLRNNIWNLSQDK